MLNSITRGYIHIFHVYSMHIPYIPYFPTGNVIIPGVFSRVKTCSPLWKIAIISRKGTHGDMDRRWLDGPHQRGPLHLNRIWEGQPQSISSGYGLASSPFVKIHHAIKFGSHHLYFDIRAIEKPWQTVNVITLDGIINGHVMMSWPNPFQKTAGSTWILWGITANWMRWPSTSGLFPRKTVGFSTSFSMPPKKISFSRFIFHN